MSATLRAWRVEEVKKLVDQARLKVSDRAEVYGMLVQAFDNPKVVADALKAARAGGSAWLHIAEYVRTAQRKQLLSWVEEALETSRKPNYYEE